MVLRTFVNTGLAALISVGATVRIDAAGIQTTSSVFRVAFSSSSDTATEHLPNVILRTQDGIRVRFYDDLVKGKVVLINFMFTSCPNQCPRTTANLVRVAEALGDHLGRDIRMISVSIDPNTDSPDVLKRYSSRYGTKPGWYFVTGAQTDIDLIRKRLGVFDDDGDKTQHTGVLVYGNEGSGQWAATPALANPRIIVRSVMRVVDRPKGHPSAE